MSPNSGIETMMNLIAEMPDHLESSSYLQGLSELTPLNVNPGSVVVCGMGGSAIAGDLLRPVFEDAGVQIAVNREYSLPGWVSEKDLLVFSSYSGNTEETLSCFNEALTGSSPKLVISSGGKLTELACENNIPVVVLPPGMPPRASLGFGLGALLNSASKLNVIPDCSVNLSEAVEVLRAGVESHSASNSLTAKLAASSLGKHLVIHTCSPDWHAVGFRIKAQVNENSKYPASHGRYPELDHNEIVGWDDTAGDYCLIVLRGKGEHPQVSKRVEITNDLLDSQFKFINEFQAKGNSKLAQIFSMVQFGDYYSCHLAQVADKDPMPVARIDTLKERLTEGL